MKTENERMVNIRNLTATLEGISPYSQSSFFVSEKKDKERPDQFEERCWRERMHVDDDGFVVIPAMSIKYSIDEACKRLALQIPGQGKARYTKHFEAGYWVAGNPRLAIKAADVQPEWLWMSSKGIRGKGGGSRVRRCYPTIPTWSAQVVIHVADDVITEDIFMQCFESAGFFVGIGRFRPENQGYYGRFKVKNPKWS